MCHRLGHFIGFANVFDRQQPPWVFYTHDFNEADGSLRFDSSVCYL